MKTFIQMGAVLALAAPYDRNAGELAKIGSIVGVAASDVASGDETEWHVEGVFDVDKAASQAWTVGVRVYWDDVAKVVTTTATSNTLIGVAVTAVAGGAGDTTGRVRLNGSF